MCLFELRLSQDICPIVGFLGPTVVLFLVFKGASILFSIVVVSVNIPTNSARGFPFFPTSSSAFIVCRFFNDDHSEQCEVIPHYSFGLHFSNI